MDAASLFQSLTSKPETPASNIITGTAVGSSEDGMVLVQVDGSAVAQPSDEEVSLTISTDEFAGGSYQLPSAPYPGTVVLTDDNDNVVDEDAYYIDGDQLTIEALDLPPVEIAYDTEVRQALTNDDFASGSITVDSTTNLALLEDMGNADWQPCAYTLDGNELTVAGIETQQGLVEFVYVRSVSLVCETGLNVLPDMPDPDDVAVTGRVNNTDYVVTSWTLDQDQLTLPSGYDAFVVDYVIEETEQWNISEQYLDEPLQDSDEAADPTVITVGHDLQYEPDSVTSCTVDGVSATYVLDGVNVVADSPSVTERYFTLTYDAPVTLEVPASEFAVGSYTLPSEPTGAVTTTSNGSTLANTVSGLELSVPSLIATSASYTIAYTAQVESDVVELPCTPAVSEGQFVDIAIVNGMPSVIGASGSGDATMAAAAAAESAATAAEAVANAVNQHFWTDGSGVHVTEVTQDEWLDPLSPNYQSGANQLSNSAGILLRDGLTNFAQLTPGETAFYDGAGNASTNVVATFGTSGSVIGKAAESHLFTDYHSMQLVDKEGNTYFHVSDLRDQSGFATITETWTVVEPSGQSTFRVAIEPTSTVAVLVNGSAHAYTLTGTAYYLGIIPQGDTVEITYQTDSPNTKVYTLGTRAAGAQGPYSFSAGQDNLSTRASSATLGCGLITNGDNQTVVGQYNDNSELATPLFMVGNGTGDLYRSNAFVVRSSGVAKAVGFMTEDPYGAGTDFVTSTSGTFEELTVTNTVIGDLPVGGDVVASNTGRYSWTGDLDDLTTTGIYYCTTASTSGPEAGSAGQCIVAASPSGTNIVQVFTTYKAATTIYARRYYSGAWSAWQALGDTVAEDTPTLSNASATTFVVRRKNGIATIYVRELAVTTALASGSAVSIATLPAGYRPTYTTGIPLTSTTANAARGVWLYVTSGGAVSIYNRSGNSLATSSNLYGTGTYVM